MLGCADDESERVAWGCGANEAVVVGAGLAGLCAARDLLDDGRQVVLLEREIALGKPTAYPLRRLA